MFTTTPLSARQVTPFDHAEALAFGRMAIKSGLVPHLRSVEEAFVLLVFGAELGMSMMQSLRNIHIVRGKPMLSADALVALVRRSPMCTSFRMIESSLERVTYETQRTHDAEPVRYTYTMDDAKRAGLARRELWRKFPMAMLRARCASNLARMVYPDVVMGLVEPHMTHTASWVHEGSDAGSDRARWLERRQRVAELTTREAARRIAYALASTPFFDTPPQAMSALVQQIEARGIAPHSATLDDLVHAWLELETPETSTRRAA